MPTSGLVWSAPESAAPESALDDEPLVEEPDEQATSANEQTKTRKKRIAQPIARIAAHAVSHAVRADHGPRIGATGPPALWQVLQSPLGASPVIEIDLPSAAMTEDCRSPCARSERRFPEVSAGVRADAISTPRTGRIRVGATR